jgi:hypothetical protein
MATFEMAAIRREVEDEHKREVDDIIEVAVERRKVKKAKEAENVRRRLEWEQGRLERGEKFDAFFVYSFELDFDIANLLVDKSLGESMDEVVNMFRQEDIPILSFQQLDTLFCSVAPARVSMQARRETASKHWTITAGPTPSSLTITSPYYAYEIGEEGSNKAILVISKVLEQILPTHGYDKSAFMISLPQPGFRVYTWTGACRMSAIHTAKLLSLLWVYEQPLDTIYSKPCSTKSLTESENPAYSDIFSHGRLVGTI